MDFVANLTFFLLSVERILKLTIFGFINFWILILLNLCIEYEFLSIFLLQIDRSFYLSFFYKLI